MVVRKSDPGRHLDTEPNYSVAYTPLPPCPIRLVNWSSRSQTESDPLQSSLKIDSSKSNVETDPIWGSKLAPVQRDHWLCSLEDPAVHQTLSRALFDDKDELKPWVPLILLIKQYANSHPMQEDILTYRGNSITDSV